MRNASSTSPEKRRGPTAARPRRPDLFEDAGIEVERCERLAQPVADHHAPRPRAKGESDGPPSDLQPELDL